MRYILLFITVIFSYSAYSQIQISSLNKKKNDNLRIGGGLGLNFGSNNSMDLNISPFIGYALNQQFELGLSTGYQYNKYLNTKRHLLSLGPYANIYPLPNMFLRTQYEHFAGKTKIKSSNMQIHKFDDNALWVGGGYRTGDVIQMYVGFMYNVLHKEGKSLFKDAYRPIAGISIRL